MKTQQELPIIQKTYDLILWAIPLLNKLPPGYAANIIAEDENR